ncbi:MAG: hypothetical protein ACR2KW_00580, partial [Rubrobacter sp.]
MYRHELAQEAGKDHSITEQQITEQPSRRTPGPKLAARDVSMTKGDVHILDGVDFEVEAGSFVSL